MRIKRFLLVFILGASLFTTACLNDTLDPNELNVTLVFSTDGGNNIDNLFIDNYDSELILPVPIKPGNIFAGWYFDNDFLSVITAESLKLMTPNSTYIIYAKWDEGGYTISFDVNGGIDMDFIVLKYNNTIVLPTPVRVGYEFLGWYEDEVLFELESMPDYDINLTAKWSISTYTVRIFDTNDNILDSFTRHYDEELDINYEDYNMLGYDISKCYYLSNDLLLELDFEKMPDYDLNLYLEYTATKYNVTFIYDGVENITKQSFNSPIVFPDVLIDGKTFIDWYVDETYNIKFDKTIMDRTDNNLVVYGRVINYEASVVSSVTELLSALEDIDVETIFVMPGLYELNVEITRTVTILGNNFGIDANSNQRLAETIFVPATSDKFNIYFGNVVMSIEAKDVVIDGIVVDGDNPEISNIWNKSNNDAFIQIVNNAVSGGKMTDMQIASINYFTSMIGKDLNVDSSVGIYAVTQKNEYGNLTVINSVVRNFTQYGIIVNNLLYNSSDVTNNDLYAQAKIENNLFSNIYGLTTLRTTGEYYGHYGRALALNNGVYGVIKNNVFKNSSMGVDLYRNWKGEKETIVYDNEFENVNAGLWINSTNISTHIIVSKNSFTIENDYVKPIIDLDDSQGAIFVTSLEVLSSAVSKLLITDNTINNYEQGIVLGGIPAGLNVDIINNDFSNIHKAAINIPPVILGYAMNASVNINIHENTYEDSEQLFVVEKNIGTIISVSYYQNDTLVDVVNYGTLKTPVIKFTGSSTSYITWTKVAGASGYKIYFNDTLVASVDAETLRYDFSYELEDIAIHVVAISGDQPFLNDSANSNTIEIIHIRRTTIAHTSLANPTITVNNYYITKGSKAYLAYLVLLPAGVETDKDWTTLSENGDTFECDLADLINTSYDFYRVTYKMITVTYKLNNSVIIDTETIRVKSSATLYLRPLEAKEGYTNSPWSTDTAGTKPYMGDLLGANTILHVKETINKYSVTYVSEHSTTAALTNKAFNTLVTLAKPKKTDYTFIGWYLDEDFQEPVSLNENNQYIIPAHDTILYAKWIQN